MITVKTNISEVVQVLIGKLDNLADNDRAVRLCATTALGAMKTRIHEEGKASDGQQIGTYSKGYMVIRTGSFVNAKRVSRGPNTGKLKDAGVFTDRTISLNKEVGVFTGEDKVGKARPRYNRTNDPKVVLSLTRQMENDMKVITIGNSNYGIGFTNKVNYDKSRWVEAAYKKKIYSLTAEEKALVKEVFQKFVSDTLNT
jgi:hypothetical protein